MWWRWGRGRQEGSGRSPSPGPAGGKGSPSWQGLAAVCRTGGALPFSRVLLGGGGAGSVPSPSVPAPPLSTAPGAEGCGAARRVAGAARRAVPTPGLRAAARAPGGGPGASCPREEEGGPEAALRGGEGYGSWQVQSLRVPSVWHCGFINSR